MADLESTRELALVIAGSLRFGAFFWSRSKLETSKVRYIV